MVSSKALAADKANLAKARAASKGKPRSAKQIAAAKANLEKADAARALKKKDVDPTALRKGTLTHKRGRPPLGSRRAAGNLHAEPSHRKVTGVNHKFVKRLSPTSSGTRGSWKSSRAHHFKKRLSLRKKKTMHVKTWHHRKHSVTPR